MANGGTVSTDYPALILTAVNHFGRENLDQLAGTSRSDQRVARDRDQDISKLEDTKDGYSPSLSSLQNGGE